MIRPVLFAGAILAALGSTSLAQPGSVVQLPTFTSFSVSTTVSVPDSGGAYVAAMKRGAAGQATNGLGPCLGNTAFGGGMSGGGLHVRASIHDLSGMDVQMLVATGGSSPLGEVSRKLVAAPRLSQVGGGLESVADIKARHAAGDGDIELTDLLKKARDAEAQGKPGLAKIHYQMAHHRATGPLRAEIAAKLRQLSQPALAAKPAKID